MSRLRGWRELVHDAIDATTELVGEGHDAGGRLAVRIAAQVPGAGEPARAVDAGREAVTNGVLGTIRAVNGVVAKVLELGLDPVADVLPDLPVLPLRSDVLGSATWTDDALLGAVNGVVGDHLHRRRSGLDLGMGSRWGDDLGGDRVVVLIHGLATTEWSWSLGAERWLGDPAATFGTRLRADEGLAPLYVRYNTGRRVPDNGGLLADHLERVVGDATEIVLLGHSMGGLVARSAHAHGRARGHRWAGRVRSVICLGTPHRGAGLERFGLVAEGLLAAIDHPATAVTAALLRGRSAGIRDLGHGDLGEAVPLEPEVSYAFAAGSALEGADDWLGDLLVSVGSAHGPGGGAPGRVRTARFAGVLHHELQVHPDVYAFVREAVRSR